MMINPYCGFFNEERDDEYAPPYGMCNYVIDMIFVKKAEKQRGKKND